MNGTASCPDKVTRTYHPFHVELHLTLLALRFGLRLRLFWHGLGLRSLLVLCLGLRGIGQVGPEADKIILERKNLNLVEFMAPICELSHTLKKESSGVCKRSGFALSTATKLLSSSSCCCGNILYKLRKTYCHEPITQGVSQSCQKKVNISPPMPLRILNP